MWSKDLLHIALGVLLRAAAVVLLGYLVSARGVVGLTPPGWEVFLILDSGLEGDDELVHMALLLVGQLHVLWSLKVAGTVEFGVGGDGASVVLEAVDTLVLDGRVKLLPVPGAIVVPVCIESTR